MLCDYILVNKKDLCSHRIVHIIFTLFFDAEHESGLEYEIGAYLFIFYDK